MNLEFVTAPSPQGEEGEDSPVKDHYWFLWFELLLTMITKNRQEIKYFACTELLVQAKFTDSA